MLCDNALREGPADEHPIVDGLTPEDDAPGTWPKDVRLKESVQVVTRHLSTRRA